MQPDPLGIRKSHFFEPLELYRALTPPERIEYVLKEMPFTLIDAWTNQFGESRDIGIRIVSWLILGLAILGLARRVARNKLDAWYVLAFLMVVWIWPYPSQSTRFLWSISFFLLFYAAEAAASICSSERNVGLLGILSFVALLALITPSWARYASRLSVALPPELDSFRGSSIVIMGDIRDSDALHGRLRLLRAEQELFLALRNIVPADECITTARRDEVIFWARRGAILPPPASIDDRRYISGVSRCRFILIDAGIAARIQPLEKALPAARKTELSVQIDETTRLGASLVELKPAPRM